MIQSDVPIVGLDVEGYECVVLATAKCLCHPGNQPFLLQGVDAAMCCERCGRIYAITGVWFDRTKGPDVSASVRLVGRQPMAAEGRA